MVENRECFASVCASFNAPKESLHKNKIPMQYTTQILILILVPLVILYVAARLVDLPQCY